jgi:hypothetical protein
MKHVSRTFISKVTSLLFIITLLSVAAPVSAVDNSVLDRTRHAVGLLGFDVDGPGPIGPFVLCSGFVISDHAFATAAHCVVAMEPLGVSFVVTLESGTPDDPVAPPGIFDLTVYNFTDFPILVDTVMGTGHYVHPNFDPTTRANDVAVIEFPAGTFAVKPVRLPEEGFLDRLDTVGVLYDVPIGLAGYGADEDLGNLEFAIPGYRKRGFGIATDLSEQWLIMGTNEVMDSINLPGDSGSPQFVLGRAVSLASHDHVVKQRLDTPSVLSFLAGFTN